jgi:hypothetical protein
MKTSGNVNLFKLGVARRIKFCKSGIGKNMQNEIGQIVSDTYNLSKTTSRV